ncbi:PEP-CTERM sorting domain-containing protein [Glacieibacterium frigidum]|uniref:PEP-CTERM sorting domain-containing protein n=2 Tax=Glacieibacterium frigidum TaxID=2593303 RepID=A0A552UJI3_9SPHN|nr:PEP-CTERM sorting domain-containing protein [Glacieibacterium frigidum]
MAIAAAWHMSGAGDLLWVDIQQLDSCSSGCDVTGYSTFARSWTRVAQAGDSLFLTITAKSFGDMPANPVPSIGAFTAGLASDGFRSAQSMMTRSISISAVPEPASWALLIAGFGAVGSAARRRRATRATVAG